MSGPHGKKRQIGDGKTITRKSEFGIHIFFLSNKDYGLKVNTPPNNNNDNNNMME